MKCSSLIASLFLIFIMRTAAQQNWAAVPCFELKYGDAIGRILKNEAQKEIILCSYYSYEICNSTYKAFFAFDGNSFHDMDFGIEVQNPNPYLGYSAKLNDCVEWNGKALITGAFSTVGSDTLLSKSIAVWNGTKWDTFPHPLWSNRISTPNTNVGVSKLLKDSGNIWMFTGYDTLQNLTFIPILFDGLSFNSLPQIPVNNKNAVTKAVKFQNNVVVTGNFLNYPSLTYYRLAQWDGTNWLELGNGAPGSLTGVADLCVYNDTLYIAGNFSKADGCKGNYVMKWDGTQLTDAGFGNWCGYGPVRKLLTYRNRLYAFGGFNCAAGQKAFGVAYYENGNWIVPHDSIENGVSSAAIYGGEVYIGGVFNSINGDSSLHKFVKLICPDFDAANGCVSGLSEREFQSSVRVFPNPTTERVEVQFDGQLAFDKISLFNIYGELVYCKFNPDSKIEINLTELNNGIYLLRIGGKNFQRNFKIVKH